MLLLLTVAVLAVGISGCGKLAGLRGEEPVSASEQLERARKLIRSGDYQAALVELNEALNKSPNDPRIHLNLGWLYLYTGELPLAKQELERVSKSLPDDSETYHLRGSLLSHLNQQEDAVKNFKIALSKDPKNEEIFFDLGNSLTALNRNREAIDYLDHGFEYIKNDDLQTQLNFLLATCGAHSRLKEFKEAIEDCQQAAELTPNPQEKQRIQDMIQNMNLIQQIETPIPASEAASE